MDRHYGESIFSVIWQSSTQGTNCFSHKAWLFNWGAAACVSLSVALRVAVTHALATNKACSGSVPQGWVRRMIARAACWGPGSKWSAGRALIKHGNRGNAAYNGLLDFIFSNEQNYALNCFWINENWVLCLVRSFYSGPDVEESFATVGPTEAYGLVRNEPSYYKLQLHCQACKISCYSPFQTTPAPHSTLFLLPTIAHILEWLECYMNH